MTAQPIIEVEGLIKRYNDFIAVNGIHFQVMRGEVFGLLGPNGAGKTTTMEMIEGLRKPDGGTAKVAGFDTAHELRKVKEVIGVQLQSTSLFDLLKVKEIITMYASFYDKSLPVKQLIDDMQLTEKWNGRVKSLSGGQKQRLAIALALVNDPQIVFLDEPTTGLDPQARRVLWDIILKLKQEGKTIVLSTHYMEEASILCDRICLMDRGEIIALDTPANLIRKLSTDSAIEFRVPEGDPLPEAQDRTQGSISKVVPGHDSAQSHEFVQRLEHLEGVKRVEHRKDSYVLYTDHLQKSLLDFVRLTTEQHFTFTDLQTRTASLEDVFIEMTGRSLREE